MHRFPAGCLSLAFQLLHTWQVRPHTRHTSSLNDKLQCLLADACGSYAARLGTDPCCIAAARRNTKVRKCCEQDSEGRACTKKRRGIFQPDACNLQAGQSSIQALPADVLLQVFAFMNPKAQREVLPLVCRQWQEVLQGPVALWRHLELDFPAAMDLGLDGASLSPSRHFQVCHHPFG